MTGASLRRRLCGDRFFIYLAAFLRAVATGMVGIVLGLYFAHLAYTPEAMGAIVSAGLWGGALGALLVTLRGDAWGRRASLIALGLLSDGGQPHGARPHLAAVRHRQRRRRLPRRGAADLFLPPAFRRQRWRHRPVVLRRADHERPVPSGRGLAGAAHRPGADDGVYACAVQPAAADRADSAELRRGGAAVPAARGPGGDGRADPSVVCHGRGAPRGAHRGLRSHPSGAACRLGGGAGPGRLDDAGGRARRAADRRGGDEDRLRPAALPVLPQAQTARGSERESPRLSAVSGARGFAFDDKRVVQLEVAAGQFEKQRDCRGPMVLPAGALAGDVLNVHRSSLPRRESARFDAARAARVPGEFANECKR